MINCHMSSAWSAQRNQEYTGTSVHMVRSDGHYGNVTVVGLYRGDFFIIVNSAVKFSGRQD